MQAQPTDRAEARARLRDLLCSLFPDGPDALRTFVRFTPNLLSLADSIAWDRDLRAVVEQVIERCEARGLLTDELFAALLRERPRRAREIADIAALWDIGVATPATLPVEIRPRRLASIWLPATVGFFASVIALSVWLGEAEVPNAIPPSGAPPIDAGADKPPTDLQVAPKQPADAPQRPAVPAIEAPTKSPTAPRPSATKASSNRSTTCERQVIDRLTGAGAVGGHLHDCWLRFWDQTTTRAADCHVTVQRTRDGRAALKLDEPRQRMQATSCIEQGSLAVLQSLPACRGEFTYQLTLASIQPSP